MWQVRFDLEILAFRWRQSSGSQHRHSAPRSQEIVYAYCTRELWTPTDDMARMARRSLENFLNTYGAHGACLNLPGGQEVPGSNPCSPTNCAVSGHRKLPNLRFVKVLAVVCGAVEFTSRIRSAGTRSRTLSRRL